MTQALGIRIRFMKAKDLAKEILTMIESGELDPDAIVVRPFCMCDERNGWIEARFVDAVFRKPIKADSDNQMYECGNSEDKDAILTINPVVA